MYGVISSAKAQMYSLVVPQICSLVNFGEVKFSISRKDAEIVSLLNIWKMAFSTRTFWRLFLNYRRSGCKVFSNVLNCAVDS